MDKNELKIQALLEKISKIAATYENQEADYRVEITLLNAQNQELHREIQALKEANEDAVQPEEIVIDDETD